MSGTLEVLVFAPAEKLPCLRPTYGNAPCSFATASWGDASKPFADRHIDEALEAKPDIHVDMKDHKDTNQQNDFFGGETPTAETGPETKTTPRPNPWALLEEALGLERHLLRGDQSPLRENTVDGAGAQDDRGTTREAAGAEGHKERQVEAIATAGSRLNRGAGNKYDYSEREYWPHEPRYCADVWRAESSRDDGNARRYVGKLVPGLTTGGGTGWYCHSFGTKIFSFVYKPRSVSDVSLPYYRKNIREISTGDKLFVPSGGGVSWRAKGDETSDEEAVAIRFCYVDASNFNSVKSQLPLYAAVEVTMRGC